MGIYRELQAKGYRGSYASLHAQFAKSSSKVRTKQALSSPLAPVFPSARQATWLFLRRPEDLTTEEQEMVVRLRQLHPELDLAYVLVQQFASMVRTRTGERLDAWLSTVASSPLVDLQSFAKRVSEEKEAIFAGLTRDESNGPDSGTHYSSQTDQKAGIWASQLRSPPASGALPWQKEENSPRRKGRN